MNKLSRIIFAGFFSLSINTLLAFGLLELKASQQHNSIATLKKKHMIDFIPVKKKQVKQLQKKPRQRQKTVQPRSLAPPKLPSALAVKGIELMELDVRTTIKPTFSNKIKASAELIMSEESVDQPPRAIKKHAPNYPPRAAEREIEGFVVCRLLVDKHGHVKTIQIERSKPKNIFDQAAKQAIQRWRFTPARFQGKAVSVWVRQRLVFQLGGF